MGPALVILAFLAGIVWVVAFAYRKDRELAQSVNEPRMSYAWIGLLFLGALGLVGFVVVYIVRRQKMTDKKARMLAYGQAAAPQLFGSSQPFAPVATIAPSQPYPPVPMVAAGWYSDPSQRFEFRFWDGARWTDNVSSAGQTSVAPLESSRS